jgi:cation transport ATPase
VAGARLAPSRLQRQADRLVAWFLPVVAVVSAATFAFWIFRAPWERALFNAMAVLLVACPCAAGLATPVAVWGGLARLASFGLVARTGDVLDALARCDVICLDKTGTLSTATPTVRAWRIAPAFCGREAWLRAAVAAAEDGLAHPIAAGLRGDCQPIVDKDSVAIGVTALPGEQSAADWRPRPNREKESGAGNAFVLELPWCTERRIEPGLGVVAQVEDATGARVEIRVGERRLGEVAARAPGLGGLGRPAGAGSPGTGEFPLPGSATAGKEISVFVDGVPAAAIEMTETWRDGMEEALAELAALGVEAEVLTGDGAAGRVAGAQVRAGLTPAEKLERVQELVAAGHEVVFVGDGVNDAAAMSAAQASIAMQAGADLARAAAMAVFAGDDLRFLPQAIRVARAARRSIRTNLRFAAAYNLIGMALAAAGILHPVVAALLMVGSSALVSANALRGVGAWNARPQTMTAQPVATG